MTDKEDFIVQKPYQPTEKEKQAIKELEAKEQGLVADDCSAIRYEIVDRGTFRHSNGLCCDCASQT